MRPFDEWVEIGPDHTIQRVIVGGWQFAEGHRLEKAAGSDAPIDVLLAAVQAGARTFDCADIYTGVEELYGELLRRVPEVGVEPAALRIHTKYVPDRSLLETLTPRQVEATIDRSLRRLGVERLDLVQFHWWEWDLQGHVEVGLQLARLQQAGKIRSLGVTNYDATRLGELLDAGVDMRVNQVQYSVIDRRPETELVAFCREHGVQLLCYGTLAGGFLSAKWLGAEDPETHDNRSRVKYRLMIEELGGWDAFQELLNLLARGAPERIAPRSTVWTLRREAVAAAIVGARSVAQAIALAELPDLDAGLDRALDELGVSQGDIFGLERTPDGPHQRIMKRNLGGSPAR